MSLLDYLIVILPVFFVLGMAIYVRRYIRSVADFLSAGRIAGRYVVNIGEIANALSILGIAAYIEVTYRTGYAWNFWGNITAPLGIFLGLTGYCGYRFRETKAMSLGQFLEMRYGSRAFRMFAAFLRSIAEMLTNMIMPAIAARYFIYFLDLPQAFTLFGKVEIPTFWVLVIICMTLAISIICMGGTLALIVTDALQGVILYPLQVVFIIFILVKFSWSDQIIPVMLDRQPGQSFLNPYDVANVRDFNLFAIATGVVGGLLHAASWIGHGVSSAARSPHEAKMGGLLGAWRNAIGVVFGLAIATMIITYLNHKDFAPQAREVRIDICSHIVRDKMKPYTPNMQKKIMDRVTALPPQIHIIGVDEPLGENKDIDTVYMNVVHEALLEGDTLTPEAEQERIAKLTEGMTEEEAQKAIDEDKFERDRKGNAKFQEFFTLFHQLKFATTMRHLLPMGLMGFFCLLLVLSMISTDDTRIYSATLTLTQDVVMPIIHGINKKPLSPKNHVWTIRIVAIGIGVFFCFGSAFMSQLDYINLYSTIICSMWQGGCGPVMVFGLYSRFGTVWGAWVSLVTGMVLAIATTLCNRHWASAVYPYMLKHNMVESVGNALEKISKPLNPYVVWTMNPVKCPINATEFYAIIMLITLVLYIVVSYATKKEDFNLERMLHRGKYNLDGENKDTEKLTWISVWRKLIGITPEYTRGDKFIAWFVFFQSLVYNFFICFIGVIIWNAIKPWPKEWWGHFYFINSLVIPGIMAVITTFWFGIGGYRDLMQMFRDLKTRKVNHLDNGEVEGNVSLADKEELEAVEKTAETPAKPEEKK